MASGGPGRLGVPALFGRVPGCHSGQLLWPCVLSKTYQVAAAGILLWRRGSFVALWCWYVRRASGFCDVIGISLIERKKFCKICALLDDISLVLCIRGTV